MIDEGPCRDFTEIVRRCKHYALLRIRAQVHSAAAADDVFQRVFITLRRKIGDRVPERLMHLLNAIIAYEIKNHRRIEGRHRALGEPDADASPSSWPDPEQQLERAEREQAIRAALRAVLLRLSPYERTLLELAHTEGLGLREIGELLDRPAGTVGVDLHRARRKLGKLAGPTHDLLNGTRRKKT